MTIKSELRLVVDELETKDKVDLLKELYHDIAGKGIGGDTQLAHINPLEAALLRSFGGAGTLNTETGLPQYILSFGSGGGSPTAVYQDTMQTSRLAPEIAPYATDVLTEAQDLYRMVMDQGYDPYTGAMTAPQTAEQIAALSGTADLVGTGRPLMEEGLNIQREQLEKFTPEVAQEYMSPYQQAVTEVEKRKAVEDFQQRIMPEFEKQAVSAGGMSGMGSRAGVQAALLGQGLGTQLGDIQATGLQKAYQDAQQMFGRQKQREAAAAQQISAAGPKMFDQGLREMGALGTVGEQKQALAQKGLDEQYYKWLEQKAFPEETLAKYSGFVYGNPLMSQRDVHTTYSAPAAQGPSFGQQLLAGAGQAANIYRQAGSPSFFREGGGIASLVKRSNGGAVEEDFMEVDEGVATYAPSRISPPPIQRKPVGDPLLTESGLRALAQRRREIMEGLQQQQEARRKATRPTVDVTGTLIQSVVDSLLESKSGDPRDPQSTRTSTLLRVLDGLKTGRTTIEEAKKEIQEMEREDLKPIEVAEKEIANVELKLAEAVAGLPAAKKAKAAKILASDLTNKQKWLKIKQLEKELRIGKPRTSVFKLLGEDALTQYRETLDKTLPSMKFSNNEAVDKTIKEDISNLSDDAKEVLIQAAQQEMYLDDKLNDFTVALAKAYKKLGKDFFTKEDNINRPGTSLGRALGLSDQSRLKD